MNNKDKAVNMLGLAKRAGRLTGGETMVLDAIRSGKAKLVIVTEDASEGTKKLFNDKCAYYHVPIYECAHKYDFNHASMALCDNDFADAIKKLLNGGGE